MKREIGKVFKDSLQYDQVSVDSEEWDELAIKLDRMRFYRFSFSHFNIYYCSLILMCFLSSAFVLGKVVFSEGPKTEEKDYFTQVETNEQKEDSTAGYSDNIGPEKKIVNYPAKKDKKTDPDPKTVKGIISTTTADSSQANEDPEKRLLSEDTSHVQNEPENKRPKVKRVKKTVYVVKQDTIVVLDTLENKKSKRKE